MIEAYHEKNDNQFEIFDYDEDGQFRPIFMIGKCEIKSRREEFENDGPRKLGPSVAQLAKDEKSND